MGVSSEERVRVFARLRPPVAEAVSAVQILEGGRAISVRTDAEADVTALPTAVEMRDFTFDGVFPADTTQEAVFAEVGQPVLAECLRGVNGTIFAYGQTGSGKTHSLLQHSTKRSEESGLLPRLVASLFASIGADAASVFEVEAGAVQVYNEQVDDLLHPGHQSGGGQNLGVQNGGEVLGLTWLPCQRADQMLAAFARARANVVYAETRMNKASSRSHAIFQVKLTKHGWAAAEGASGPLGPQCVESTRARLCVVDLAGSERVKKSGVEGVHFKEAAAINRSLLALGCVVSALAAKKPHVPLRDSKLTRLLDGSLGGNCKTVLLCCASPAAEHAYETLSSFEFASRAMRVQVDARVNRRVVVVDPKAVLQDLGRQQSPAVVKQSALAAAQEEVCQLRAELAEAAAASSELQEKASHLEAAAQSGKEVQAQCEEQLKCEAAAHAGATMARELSQKEAQQLRAEALAAQQCAEGWRATAEAGAAELASERAAAAEALRAARDAAAELQARGNEALRDARTEAEAQRSRSHQAAVASLEEAVAFQAQREEATTREACLRHSFAEAREVEAQSAAAALAEAQRSRAEAIEEFEAQSARAAARWATEREELVASHQAALLRVRADFEAKHREQRKEFDASFAQLERSARKERYAMSSRLKTQVNENGRVKSCCQEAECEASRLRDAKEQANMRTREEIANLKVARSVSAAREVELREAHSELAFRLAEREVELRDVQALLRLPRDNGEWCPDELRDETLPPPGQQRRQTPQPAAPSRPPTQRYAAVAAAVAQAQAAPVVPCSVSRAIAEQVRLQEGVNDLQQLESQFAGFRRRVASAPDIAPVSDARSGRRSRPSSATYAAAPGGQGLTRSSSARDERPRPPHGMPSGQQIGGPPSAPSACSGPSSACEESAGQRERVPSLRAQGPAGLLWPTLVPSGLGSVPSARSVSSGAGATPAASASARASGPATSAALASSRSAGAMPAADAAPLSLVADRCACAAAPVRGAEGGSQPASERQAKQVWTIERSVSPVRGTLSSARRASSAGRRAGSQPPPPQQPAHPAMAIMLDMYLPATRQML